MSEPTPLILAPAAPTQPRARARERAGDLAPAALLIGLLLVWVAHDGGYDLDTWYWGALGLLGFVTVATVRGRLAWVARSPALRLAVIALAGYVCWSYLSIAWAAAPGIALDGSNRSLLYLLVFLAFAALRPTEVTVLRVLTAFALGVGAIALLLLLQLAEGRHLSTAIVEGRLLAPAGYFNGSAALFTTTALLSCALAAVRELPLPVRGLLVATACASLQLAILAQSRGWLFTLPLVLAVALVVMHQRLRVVGVLALAGALALLNTASLLQIYTSSGTGEFTHAVQRAGRLALILWAAAALTGTALAALQDRAPWPKLSPRARRAVGTGLAVLSLLGGSLAGMLATHGHPFRFISRQWHGFTHTAYSASSTSHFAQVGSGRYDMWRVSLDAVLAHPIGGLGQDNFGEYYLPRRHTSQEPSWTHSLEMRLLAHTGLVGTALFLVFLAAAIAAARNARRRGGPLGAAVIGAGLLPFVVWLIHGSIDWFWELPALTGPALGFLALLGAINPVGPAPEAAPRRAMTRRLALGSAGAVGFLAALAVLAFPYLAVREVSTASDIGLSNLTAALRDLEHAAQLNPLDAASDRIAGALALQASDWTAAEQRFSRSLSRDGLGWFSWLGRGLAASSLGQRAQARYDFSRAYAINSKQPAVREALQRVDTTHPLTVRDAFGAFIITR